MIEDIAKKGGAYSDVNMMFVYFTLKRGIILPAPRWNFADRAIAQIDRHQSLFSRSPISLEDQPLANRNRVAQPRVLNDAPEKLHQLKGMVL